MNTLLLVLDLIGTFVFAVSGATAGVGRRLDIFGVLVLSFVVGNLGGITRDLLIGTVPPGAISDWRYLAVSVFAGMITFWWPTAIERLRQCSCSTVRGSHFSLYPARKRRSLSGSIRSWRRSWAC